MDDAEWDVKSMGRTIELLSRVTRAALEASGDLAAAEVLMEAVQARIEEVKASQVVDEAAVTAYQEICRAARSCIDWFNWDVKEGKAEELRGFLLKSYELYRSMNELTQQAAEEYYYDYLYDAEDILFSYDQNAVKNLIAALPSLQGLAAEDAEAVQAARAAYNALVKMTGEGEIGRASCRERV